ncbi:pepSY-associated TM helix family protein [Sphingomonas sp. S17]|uniref:PepSY domain-containing protein n=2 Tax=Sphingomonas paucimobilis TaxID=13689 RepID=A0A411LHP2_SPHPI|nr:MULTISPECIES: PepSY domain-containing protein [Sphingomonas]EGI54410.1 pepSY-associated TM helix family protein [Sphingomonas sp. S17]MBQ1481055.1 PepSY domain-containing protein [Sphingomonas sp.]MCM3677927.1 PepSY domain-containing protein [Sphingomonas paucimobilis]MDG5972557.1 PepSY domain-containing protein [Sphingomonas paucimobilis]NNG58810.1 PepSY domain-containing protein [Sphingomonas paucimobilis]
MTAAPHKAAFHRTIWRWHFWAGLLVLPVLLMLSLTGAIYLFNDELNDAIYPEMRLVAPHARQVPISRMIEAALVAYPGTASRVDMPGRADRSAVIFVNPDQGEPRRVAVDPGTGRVLGSVVYDRTLVGWADAMHRSMLLGIFGERLVELAACWALVLLATGMILWWPRGGWRAGGTFWPRLSGRGRRFWRDLHGPVGLWTGALIGFLVLTGLPWAGVTGPLLHRVSGAAGVGYPSSYRQYNIPYSVPAKTALGDAPWTLEDAPMPRSMAPGPTMAGHGHAMMAPDEHAEHREHGPGAPGATRDPAVIRGTDQVARIVSGLGWKSSYRLFLPGGPTGVYTAFTYPDRPQGQQTIYVDRYSLRPIGPEVRFADYGAVGRAVEWGVQVHMGNYFGRANQLLMLTACVGVWLLAISGIAMWWKRRPAGRVGAPPPLSGARVGGLLVSLGIMALLLPLFGASLLVVAALDRAVGRLLGRRATAS